MDPQRTSEATTVPDRWDRQPPRRPQGSLRSVVVRGKNIPEDPGATPSPYGVPLGEELVTECGYSSAGAGSGSVGRLYVIMFCR